MQFHLNGFRPGDPDIAEAAEPDQIQDLPVEIDVLIVGCGPAGLTLAAQLSAFPEITARIVEQKSGPLQIGQADGIACRTVEMFHAFGFAERVLREAYWVNETVFWKPDERNPIHIARSRKIEDTEEGLSEFPHVILSQARIHDFYLDVMAKSPSRLVPDYNRKLTGLIDRGPAPSPVEITLERIDGDGQIKVEEVRARYVVGCDGARSAVREALGLKLYGDSANQAWGVMDVLVETDFPDIRLKSVIQSANEGNVLIIPREGGYMVRLYIELEKLNPDERVSSKNITPEQLVSAANRIMQPYKLDVKEIAWWSVYEIGQRLCDKFDNTSDFRPHPNVFITGDACHTHSPKAGQGMNVSMGDAFNLGWKLAAVLKNRAAPELLSTYSSERQTVARELIEFDREFARMFSAAPRTGQNGDSEETVDPAEFQKYFVQHGRFTAGTAIHYYPSIIRAEPDYQHLAEGVAIGMRFHSAPVIRLADARPIHLGHVVKADGRWRLFAFADVSDAPDRDCGVRRLCSYLENDPGSPIRRFTPKNADIDSVIDVRAVFRQYHRDLDVGTMPDLLRPLKGRYGLRDHEKIFCPDFSGGNIFETRAIHDSGCVVIVRPDQYVADVVSLGHYDRLAAFFERFMLVP